MQEVKDNPKATPVASNGKCSKKVYPSERWGFVHGYQCTKKAVVERDGKPYCRIHDPEYIKQRDDERQAEWRRKSNEEWRRTRIKNAADSMLAALEKIQPYLEEHGPSTLATVAQNAINEARGTE